MRRKIVSELGFGNIAIGALGVLSIFNAAWIVPAAIAMAIFYALAGGKHVMNAERTASENWAMGSDLWAAVVLAGWLVVVWVGAISPERSYAIAISCLSKPLIEKERLRIANS